MKRNQQAGNEKLLDEHVIPWISVTCPEDNQPGTSIRPENDTIHARLGDEIGSSGNFGRTAASPSNLNPLHYNILSVWQERGQTTCHLKLESHEASMAIA